MSAIRIGVLLLLLLLINFEVAQAETIVRVTRDGRPVRGIETMVVNLISGKQIFKARSGDGGLLRLDELENDVTYQVQNLDGTAWSEPFGAGDTVDLEVGSRSWKVMAKAGFALGLSNTRIKRDPALDIELRDLGAGGEIGLWLAAPPRKLLVFGVRPFLETGIQIAAVKPDGYTDSSGDMATVEDSIRWRLGGGLAVPLTIISYDMSAEAAFHYVLTASELIVEPQLAASSSKKFVAHGVAVGIGMVFPLGRLGPIGTSFDFGGRVHLPVAGSTKIDSGLEGKPGLDVRLVIGFRGTFTGISL